MSGRFTHSTPGLVNATGIPPLETVPLDMPVETVVTKDDVIEKLIQYRRRWSSPGGRPFVPNTDAQELVETLDAYVAQCGKETP